MPALFKRPTRSQFATPLAVAETAPRDVRKETTAQHDPRRRVKPGERTTSVLTEDWGLLECTYVRDRNGTERLVPQGSEPARVWNKDNTKIPPYLLACWLPGGVPAWLQAVATVRPQACEFPATF